MSTIYLVSGGARSGKSGYAQKLCEYLSPEPIYLATSEIFDNDEDFAKRVKKHQQDRGDQWTTIEEPLEPSKHLEKLKGRVVLVDCCTLWLTNYMMQEGLFSLDETTNDDDNGEAKGDGLVQDASERALEKIEQEVRRNIEEKCWQRNQQSEKPRFCVISPRSLSFPIPIGPIAMKKFSLTS
jgi:adenosyl cobinamide kinase/adenosyl cobinamide phosphate guanylyltransferase